MLLSGAKALNASRPGSSFAGKQLVARPVAAKPRSGRTSFQHGGNRNVQRRLPANQARASLFVQANLFARLTRLIRSTIDNLISSFEDPERLLDRVVLEMQDDIIRLRQASAQLMASQRQMQARQKSLQDGADQWLRRAELAVQKGEDELAREALRRRKVFQDDADRMGVQTKMQQTAADQLTANLRTLENKVTEARGKKESLKARAISARSSQQVQEMIGGLRSTNSTSWAAFEKMEERVVSMEAQAETAMAMIAPDGLEQKFMSLEGNDVDHELSALKRGVLPAGTVRSEATAAITSKANTPAQGRPWASAIDVDAELEELRRRAKM